MEKSMQPTVQSEQDKMVPIDTSGDPVEVELKDEEAKEENKEEVQVEQSRRHLLKLKTGRRNQKR